MKAQRKKTIIVTEYLYGLGAFLDEQNIKWRSKSIDQVGDFISIEFDQELTASEIWAFAINFKKFQEKYN